MDMKIAEIKAIPVAVPYIGKNQKKAPLTAVLCSVTTDEGITGYGESRAYLGGEITARIIENCAPLLIGCSTKNINPLVRRLHISLHANTLHIQSVSHLFAGVELALWDIVAKEAKMPLHTVWGGDFRKRIELSGRIDPGVPADMEGSARALAAEGYRYFCTTIGGDPILDVERIRAIRRGIPDASRYICADAEQSWPTGTAVDVIRQIQDQGIGWIEQPTMRYNLQSMRDVKGRVHVPIMCDESGADMYDVLNVMKENAADYFRLNAETDAGYNGVRISAGIAESAGVQCVYSDSPMLGIAFAGALQLMAAYPNFSLPWSCGSYEDLADDIISGGKFTMSEIPYIDVPQTPGIGVVPDAERIEKYHQFYLDEVLTSETETTAGDPKVTGMLYRQYYKDFEE